MIRTFLSALGLAAVVQGATQSVTVCSAGECLTGNSNITRLGAVLSASSSGSYILLPGQYTSSVQPATLEQALASATSTLVLTTGFGNSTSSTTPTLPLNIALQPGLLNYPNDLYSGDPTFLSLPQNVNGTFNSTAINRGSIILSANTVAAIQANNNGAKNRIVLWDTVPYISQLPYDMAGNLEIVSLQSSLCSPACSNSGICSTSGTCVCKPNFTGDSCEQCADGHFGPNCAPCPTGCGNCDSGITGTGTCLSVQLPSNAPQNCNCGQGTCNGGTCTCAPGWATSTTGGNSTQCNTCAPGFFLDSDNNCSACGARCQACSANTGTCTQCDTNNLTPGAGGNPLQCALTTTCATNEFLGTAGCTRCNGACASCFGADASSCLLCAGNNILLNGQCVPVSLTSGAAGICSGTALVANRAKGVCDVCPLGCSNCAYDTFDQQSTQYSSVKCTKCEPGKFLSSGNCVDTCPDGSFAASDGTCTTCSSSCATCIGSATTCLTCKNNQLASAGTCVSNCPTNSFSSAGKCTSCHPDCSTCSGPGFNQCLTCPDSNPVLTSSKRCVTTCAKTEYFDEGSGSCKSCDSSCGSCSSGGSTSCLSCSSSTQVLRAGKCVSVNCGNGSAGPTSGLGVCLAELVQVPNSPPPATIPPLDPNAQQPTSGGGHGLKWWQILLIVLGALLILAIILLLWRRRQRKKRAQQTEQFKQNMKHQGLWGKFFRNPFSAWWARRRAAAINRRSRSDIERKTDTDWRNTQSEPFTPGTLNNHSPGLSNGERRPAVGVPRSIGHTSWITMGQQDGRSYMTGPNNAGLGLGAIRERDEGDRYTTRSGRSAKESYRSRRDDMRYGDEYRRGESHLWGQEIEQDDSRSERTRTDQTYLRSGVTGDPYQFDRPSSRNSDNQTDLVSIIRSEGVSERWDDRDRRLAYERSRSGYERSERSRQYDERSYRTRDRDYPRQDYPASVSTESQSRSYDRDRRGYGSSSASRSHGPETPSLYSQPTLPRLPPHAALDESPRDAVLSSRFSMSTTAASTRPPPKRKQVPHEPMPLDLPPRQLTDAEMYKMSKVFPDLLGMLSPTKKSPPATTAVKSPSRNPFRI